MFRVLGNLARLDTPLIQRKRGGVKEFIDPMDVFLPRESRGGLKFYILRSISDF